MSETQKNSGTLQLIKLAVATLVTRRVVLLPFAITAFIQLFVLEVLYFLPQPPLNRVFGPVIKTLWAEEYLHYPMNFVLLPKLFQYAQMPIYIFVSSFFICVSIGMLVRINNDQAPNFKQVARDVFRESYIYIFVAAALSIIIVFIFYKVFGFVYLKAYESHAVSGLHFWIKTIIVGAAPAINILMSIVVTTLFA
jgi:hypothetical protein